MQYKIITENPITPPAHFNYTVQSGDTLWEIAKKYRTTVDNILRANPNLEENGNLINIGQQIMIPKVS